MDPEQSAPACKSLQNLRKLLDDKIYEKRYQSCLQSKKEFHVLSDARHGHAANERSHQCACLDITDDKNTYVNI